MSEIQEIDTKLSKPMRQMVDLYAWSRKKLLSGELTRIPKRYFNKSEK